MLGVLGSGPIGLSSSPGRSQCVVLMNKTLSFDSVSLHFGEKMGTRRGVELTAISSNPTLT